MTQLLLLLACFQTAEHNAVLTDHSAWVDREVLVSVADLGDGVARMHVEQTYGLIEVERNEAIGVSLLAFDHEDLDLLIQDMEQDWRVEFAEPNYIVTQQGTPNDPYVGYQWNLSFIDAPQAWDTADGTGAVVAVLDTGVSEGADGFAHLLQGYDFYYDDSDPSDRVGHGTHVAGTIAQATNNGVGVAGVAPGASILPVKVLGDNGYGSTSAIAKGIVYATDQGADVINMSLGGAYYSSTQHQAVRYAHDRGVVIVAATGNEFASSIGYPAGLEEVIAVGAGRADGSRAPYSNTGTGIDLIAPGGDMSRDDNGDGYGDGILQETLGGYQFYEGTSMATPHVAGAAAVLVSMGIEDPEQIRDILTSTARDVGSPGYDTSTGWGYLDLAAAVANAEPAPVLDTTAPLIQGVTVSTDGDRFRVAWTTDEPATSQIQFTGWERIYGSTDLKTSHDQGFRGSEGSSYGFTVISTDAEGNTRTSTGHTVSL